MKSSAATQAATALGDDALYLPRDAAPKVGASEAALQKWRTEGTGPVFVKLGKRKVGYRASDLRNWLESRAAVSTADAYERGLSSMGGPAFAFERPGRAR